MTVKDSLSNKEIPQTNMHPLFQFDLPHLDGGKLFDPRQDSYCTYWDESTSSWSSKGMIALGVLGSSTLCASSHLTSFGSVSRAIRTPNLAQLQVSPKSILDYKSKSPLLPATLGSLVLVMLTMLISAIYVDSRPQSKKARWRAAAQNYLRYGKVDAVKEVVRGMTFREHLCYSFCSTMVVSVHRVPLQEQYLHTYTNRCAVLMLWC